MCATFDSSTLGVLAAAIGKGSYSVCVDKSTGVMLETKTDDGNGKVDDLKATDFSTNTSAADFTPPSKPIGIPGLTPTT